jgi:hypothetical protein
VLKRDGHLLDKEAKAIDICQVEIEFRAIGDQTVEDALRGLEATAALVNEADRTHPDILTFLAGRVGRYNDSIPTWWSIRIVLDLNGCDDENWTTRCWSSRTSRRRAARDPRGLGRAAADRVFRAAAGDPRGAGSPGRVDGQPARRRTSSNLPQGLLRAAIRLRQDARQPAVHRPDAAVEVHPAAVGRSVFPEYIDDLHAANSRRCRASRC